MTQTSAHLGPRRAWLAAGAVLAAALTLLGLTQVTPIDESAGAMLLIVVNAVIVPAALPGTLLPAWSAMGQWALWSASGWSLLLLLAGIFSFGYLMLPPLALIVLGLALWPREPGKPAISGPALLAHIGGFLVPLLAIVFAALTR